MGKQRLHLHRGERLCLTDPDSNTKLDPAAKGNSNSYSDTNSNTNSYSQRYSYCGRRIAFPNSVELWANLFVDLTSPTKRLREFPHFTIFSTRDFDWSAG